MELTKCPFCGSSHLDRGVQIGNGENIGLRFVKGALTMGVEPMLADVCHDCRSVVRVYVKTADKSWLKEL